MEVESVQREIELVLESLEIRGDSETGTMWEVKCWRGIRRLIFNGLKGTGTMKS